MKIGELAERTGASRRLLRYYEEQGLITPSRAVNGYRASKSPTCTSWSRSWGCSPPDCRPASFSSSYRA
ncbi:MerR family DNA-binding transcriptional regulator [Mycolicibacterium hodleri]|uniref:MerR family DNA-binding transcriptional regulator n=1 Tax=Mycolicibacterium hodleri TaxID=49897 RepID=UPI003F7F0690